MRLISALLLLAACTKGTTETDTDTDVVDTDTDVHGADADDDGWTVEQGDCDDTNASVNPGAAETCDGVDEDCDGFPDDGLAVVMYTDADGDGHGDPATGALRCGDTTGYSAEDDDCDDTNPDISPDATEVCNAADDDCDGVVDDGAEPTTWYADADKDGYGDPTQPQDACSKPSGYVADASDCDDTDSKVHRDGVEVCNGVDDDCDGTVDDSAGGSSTFWPDADADGHGATSGAVVACSAPSGYVSGSDDCDDADPDVYPGAREVCDALDDDCDGLTDPDFLNDTLDATVDPLVWQLNGSATQVWSGSDGWLQLTDGSTYEAGSAFFVDTIPADRWYAAWDFYDGDGGADGQALVFLTTSDPTALGGDGGDLGYGGLSGWAVELDTWDNGSGCDPSGSHVAVTDAGDACTHYASYDVTLADDAVHHAEVDMDAGTVDVYVDGSLVLSTTLSGYATGDVLVGWTSATGAITDYHTVEDPVIGCW